MRENVSKILQVSIVIYFYKNIVSLLKMIRAPISAVTFTI